MLATGTAVWPLFIDSADWARFKGPSKTWCWFTPHDMHADLSYLPRAELEKRYEETAHSDGGRSGKRLRVRSLGDYRR